MTSPARIGRRAARTLTVATLVPGLASAIIAPQTALAQLSRTDWKIGAFSNSGFHVGERGTVTVVIENRGSTDVRRTDVKVVVGAGFDAADVRGANGQIWMCSDGDLDPRAATTMFYCTTDVIQPDSHKTLLVNMSAQSATKRWIIAQMGPDERLREDDEQNNVTTLRFGGS